MERRCHHCKGPHPAYGFVVARDERGDPVHAMFCDAPACQAAGRAAHMKFTGHVFSTPVPGDCKPLSSPFDKPPPQQDGQGRLF